MYIFKVSIRSKHGHDSNKILDWRRLQIRLLLKEFRLSKLAVLATVPPARAFFSSHPQKIRFDEKQLVSIHSLTIERTDENESALKSKPSAKMSSRRASSRHYQGVRQFFARRIRRPRPPPWPQAAACSEALLFKHFPQRGPFRQCSFRVATRRPRSVQSAHGRSRLRLTPRVMTHFSRLVSRVAGIVPVDEGERWFKSVSCLRILA